MSKVRKPILTSANASTQACGSAHQRSFASAMLSPQFLRHRLHLHHALQHGIVSVPLNEIGASHERAMLAGAPVVVPEVEVNEVDGLREWRSAEGAVFP